MSSPAFDVCVRGGGVVGHTLALLLAQQGLKVALQSQAHGAAPTPSPANTAPPSAPDVRAYALNAAARALLERVRCWPEPQHATPVHTMRVLAERGGELCFNAAEAGTEALTWIVDVPPLEARLAMAVDFQHSISRVPAPVAAPLVVVCEGKASQTRADLGVRFVPQPYNQWALALRIAAEHPHRGTATQWFLGEAGEGGILALLPLGGEAGNDYAVVWSQPPAQAQAWTDPARADNLANTLQGLTQVVTGSVQLCSAAQAWPLVQARADHWCGSQPSDWPKPMGDGPTSWALAGDAAHAVHPLAGQGLNLGLGDVEALSRHLLARDGWRSPGDLKLLRRYERERKTAVLTMVTAMDGMQNMFTRADEPLVRLRNWGLSTVNQVPVLKQWFARAAMGR